MNEEQRNWFEQKWHRIINYSHKAPSEEHWKAFVLGRTEEVSTDSPIINAPEWITDNLIAEAFAEFSISDERTRDISQKAICAEANRKRAYVDGSF
jgi:hypothetical protein